MDDQNSFSLGLNRWSEKIIKPVLKIDQTEKLYQQIKQRVGDSAGWANFCNIALTELAVDYSFNNEQIEQFKKITGPILVIANHPLGAIDALVLMAFMSRLRPNFKLVANAVLNALPELAPALVPVYILNERTSPLLNTRALRAMLKFLQNNGVVGCFPAGEVALFGEYPWSDHVGRLVLKTQATVIPLYFENKNSMAMRTLATLVPPLRLPLLVRAIQSFKNPLRLQVGQHIGYHDYAHIAQPQQLTTFLRQQVLGMKKNK